MIKNILFFLFFVLFSSCSFLKPKNQLSQYDQWMENWHQACLASNGKGQLFLNKHTYSFSYESVLNETEKFWVLALEVPFRGEESLIVPFGADQPFSGSLFYGLDPKTKKKITEKVLLSWKKSWVELILFLQNRETWAANHWKNQGREKQGREKSIEWKYSDDEINFILKSEDQAELQWQFKKTGDGYFYNQQTVTLRHQKFLQTISLHLYPTLCRK